MKRNRREKVKHGIKVVAGIILVLPLVGAMSTVMLLMGVRARDPRDGIRMY